MVGESSDVGVKEGFEPMCAELPQSNGTPQLDVSLGVSEADWIVQQDRLL